MKLVDGNGSPLADVAPNAPVDADGLTPKCSGCPHFIKANAAEVGGMGECYGNPLTPYPVPAPGGQIAVMLLRPQMPSNTPACHLHPAYHVAP